MSTGAVGSVDPSDAGLPVDAPIGTVVKRQHGGVLVRRDEAGPWTNVRVEHVRTGQPRPYADSFYEYLVTFTGGHPSTVRGWHIPFGTKSPYDRAGIDRPGSSIFDQYTALEDPWAAREQAHTQRIKEVVRGLTHDWTTDSTIGEHRSMGHTWLDRFECVANEPDRTTWRVLVVTPFMD